MSVLDQDRAVYRDNRVDFGWPATSVGVGFRQ